MFSLRNVLFALISSLALYIKEMYIICPKKGPGGGGGCDHPMSYTPDALHDL